MNKIKETQLQNSSQLTINQTTHGFVVGDYVIYDKTSSLWKKANTVGNYAEGAIGKVIDVITANDFEIRAFGIIIDFVGTAGEFYYAKDDGTGGVTLTPPVNVVQAVLFALPNNKAVELRYPAAVNLGITEEMIEVNSIPLGMPFPQWFDGNAQSVVTKYPARFIKLSKNLEAGYNSGKLGVSTANDDTDLEGDTIFYTASIIDVSSPLNGQSIHLINSTENIVGGVSTQPSFLSAGENAQVRTSNRYQSFGIFDVKVNYATTPAGTGRHGVTPNSDGSQTDYDDGNHYEFENDGVNGVPRAGKTTRPDNVTAVYYMRIK